MMNSTCKTSFSNVSTRIALFASSHRVSNMSQKKNPEFMLTATICHFLPIRLLTSLQREGKNRQAETIVGNKAICIWSRSSIILAEHIGQQYSVHNGKGFYTIKIDSQMVGHKFGEFCFTRKKAVHKSTLKKQATTRVKSTRN